MKYNIAFQQKNIERKIFQKRRKRKKWKKRKNYKKNLQKKIRQQKKTGFNFPRVRSKVVNVPSNLSLLNNTETVLEFVQICKRSVLEGVNDLFFNFSDVTEISVGSMALILSLTHDLNSNGVNTKGNVPLDLIALDKFIGSGFLNFFRNKLNNRTKHENTILVQDEGKINQVISAKEIEKAMQTVFGNPVRNGKLQGMIIEIMTNTVNHAFSRQHKHNKWYLSIFHEIEENKVKFCFVDNGKGIINTIRSKYFMGLDKTFKPDYVIEKAFEGLYGSRTKQKERGTGLIAIKKCFTENTISKLKVITNNISYDFETQLVTQLKNDFNGTFYFWELDTNCKNVNY